MDLIANTRCHRLLSNYICRKAIPLCYRRFHAKINFYPQFNTFSWSIPNVLKRERACHFSQQLHEKVIFNLKHLLEEQWNERTHLCKKKHICVTGKFLFHILLFCWLLFQFYDKRTHQIHSCQFLKIEDGIASKMKIRL